MVTELGAQVANRAASFWMEPACPAPCVGGGGGTGRSRALLGWWLPPRRRAHCLFDMRPDGDVPAGGRDGALPHLRGRPDHPPNRYVGGGGASRGGTASVASLSRVSSLWAFSFRERGWGGVYAPRATRPESAPRSEEPTTGCRAACSPLVPLAGSPWGTLCSRFACRAVLTGGVCGTVVPGTPPSVPTDSGQETGGQGVCGGCRMILLYQMGIQLVSCSFCGSVTLLPRPESFQCRYVMISSLCHGLDGAGGGILRTLGGLCGPWSGIQHQCTRAGTVDRSGMQGRPSRQRKVLRYVHAGVKARAQYELMRSAAVCQLISLLVRPCGTKLTLWTSLCRCVSGDAYIHADCLGYFPTPCSLWRRVDTPRQCARVIAAAR